MFRFFGFFREKLLLQRIKMTFDDFWNRYPRKIAKKHALTMWSRLTTEQQTKALAVIEAHVKQWAIAGRSMEVIPHAGSWLNGWRFDDEIDAPQQLIYQRDTFVPLPKFEDCVPNPLRRVK